MAELAASIIGISSFGIKLTLTLYDFGATAAAAKRQTDYIAKHVTLYSNVLELLAERLEADEPIISEAAMDVAEELYDQTDELFTRIRKLLPRTDELNFLQKIAWNFKKSKVDLLVGELECLKSTVQLLVTVVFAGKKIQSYRKRKQKVGDVQSSRELEAMKTQCIKAQTALVEQMNAADQLPSLLEEDRLSDNLTIEADVPSKPQTVTAVQVLAQQTGVLARFQDSLSSIKDSSQRQAYVLQNSTRLLHDLLRHWTNLDSDPEGLDLSQPESNGRTKNTDTGGSSSGTQSTKPMQSSKYEDQCETRTGQENALPWPPPLAGKSRSPYMATQASDSGDGETKLPRDRLNAKLPYRGGYSRPRSFDPMRPGEDEKRVDTRRPRTEAEGLKNRFADVNTVRQSPEQVADQQTHRRNPQLNAEDSSNSDQAGSDNKADCANSQTTDTKEKGFDDPYSFERPFTIPEDLLSGLTRPESYNRANGPPPLHHIFAFYSTRSQEKFLALTRDRLGYSLDWELDTLTGAYTAVPACQIWYHPGFAVQLAVCRYHRTPTLDNAFISVGLHVVEFSDNTRAWLYPDRVEFWTFPSKVTLWVAPDGMEDWNFPDSGRVYCNHLGEVLTNPLDGPGGELLLCRTNQRLGLFGHRPSHADPSILVDSQQSSFSRVHEHERYWRLNRVCMLNPGPGGSESEKYASLIRLSLKNAFSSVLALRSNGDETERKYKTGGRPPDPAPPKGAKRVTELSERKKEDGGKSGFRLSSIIYKTLPLTANALRQMNL